MLLDEPTNDLDIETLDVLEEMLGDYLGTVVLISHDRDFLDRVVNAVVVPEGDGRWSEYAGGYSDMTGQRGGDVTGRQAISKPPTATPEKKTAPTAQAKAAKRRLSYNEQRALQSLPATIASLGADVDDLQRRLGDPGLYARDPAAFRQASEALVVKQSQLEAAEEKWLELEIRREAIERD
jgi:ATP-binding cassette subfamily F protein uup